MTQHPAHAHPPALALWMLEHWLPNSEREHVVGDLIEDFATRAAREGSPSTRHTLRFWKEAMSAVWSVRQPRHAVRVRNHSRGDAPMRTFLRDVRLSARGAVRAPGFTLLAALTLGFGIGATAAMFGVIERLVLRAPDHIANADRVMRFYATLRHPPGEFETGSITGYAAYAALRDGAHVFDGVAAYDENSRLVGRGVDARRVPVVAASASLFPLLGVQPLFGRFYTAAEDEPNAARDVVVLSYEYWKSAFAGDRAVLGRTMIISDRPFTIIGVLPAGFTGVELSPVDFWIPLSSGSHPRPDWTTTWQARWVQVVGRLAPGVSAERASRDATLAIRRAYTGQSPDWRDAVWTVRPISYTSDGVEPPVNAVARWLAGVAAIVLLIACANVGNLVLARTLRRRQEMAVRLVLGMGRARLAQLLVAEGLLIATLAGLVGAGVASAAGALVRGYFLTGIVWTTSVVDGRVLLATLALTIAVALLVSAIPMLHLRRTDIGRALKAGAREGGGRQHRLRSALLVAQTTLTVVLLVGAGLFVRSLEHVRALDLGVETDRVLVGYLTWPTVAALDSQARAVYDERRSQEWTRIRETVAKLPEFDDASLAIGTPFGAALGLDVRVPGRDSLPQLGGGGPYVSAVGPDYFTTVGTHVLRGRPFAPTEGAGSPRTVIVNETAARTLWPRENPIGQCLMIGEGESRCSTVVGVAADAHRFGIEEEPAIQLYVPLGQESSMCCTALLARTRPGARGAAATLRRALAAMVPNASSLDVAVMQDRIDPQIRPWRLGAAMFALFGALALVVAATGLYSVISYVAAQRTHEIGVRIAVGASARHVVWLMLAQTLRVTAIGSVLGAVLAVWGGRWVGPQLFHESPHDPVVFATVLGMIAIASLAASIVPVARAAAVDPLIALRAE